MTASGQFATRQVFAALHRAIAATSRGGSSSAGGFTRDPKALDQGALPVAAQGWPMNGRWRR